VIYLFGVFDRYIGKTEVLNLKQTVKRKGNSLRPIDINEFKKSYQSGTNLIKYLNDNIFLRFA
jgi:hypothetical protein